MMTLFLIRHGIAAPQGSMDDAARPLTEEGIDKTRQCAAGFAQFAAPQIILTSPLVRARQTADIFAAAFKPKPPVQEIPELAGHGNFDDLLKAVGKTGQLQIALVGHEPDFSELTSWLLSGNTGTVGVDFKKAGACRIDFEDKPAPGEGMLIWFLPPKVLMALA